MIPKYDDCSNLKKEMEKYLCLLNKNKKLPYKNVLINITKYIIFMKAFSENGKKGYYKNFMIYDLLMLMHSLTQNSVRNFYQTYRSFIENFIRVVINLDDNDETGVRKLFEELNKKFNSSSEVKEIIDYFNGEYSKACRFVHSNPKANISVYTYYMDIIKTDEMNDHSLKSLIKRIQTLMQKATTFILYVFPNVIEEVFFRKKQELRFLIGEKNYDIFKISLHKYLN